MKATIKQLIRKAITELFGLSEVAFTIEPTELSHGDFATNVALITAKQIGKNPKEVADAIVEHLHKDLPEMISSVHVAGPGFINIFLSSAYFGKTITSATSDPSWGSHRHFEGKKILVEHSSPNLFKPFHIGHLMNNTIGEAITRLAKLSGAHVTTISFPSDISLGVAKAIFILLETEGPSFTPENVATLGDAYVQGVKRYDEDESIHARVKEIADNLYGGVESPEWQLFQRCKAFNIAYFESVVAKLGSHFDAYIYESEAGIEGKKIVSEYTPKVFTESEGAVVYIPEPATHLHTAVFLNSQGNPTYEAKDLGLLELKFNRYNPDLSIFITDGQQVSHFAVVLDAAGRICPPWKERSFHRYHGRMSFKGQKMASRLGGVPLVEDILLAVGDEVKEKNPDSTKEASDTIALAAIKFVILRTMAGKNINFDPDTSLSFEGDSGPYLQYTAVRARSGLAKALEQGFSASFDFSAKTTDLERLIARFPDVVLRSTVEWAPHYIVTYLLELSQAFNSWYGNTKIINTEDGGTPHRLSLVEATQRTIQNGLWILGIEVPEKM